MTWLTHTTFAYFTSELFGLSPMAVLGSTAPDWSEDLLGIREHRGRTHYVVLWFSAFITALSLYLVLESSLLYHALSFIYGGLTHLFLDTLTVSGVPLGVYNMRIRITGLVRTGKLSEWIFLACLMIVFVPLHQAGSLELGFSKYKELHQEGIIDRREYKERKLKFWE